MCVCVSFTFNFVFSPVAFCGVNFLYNNLLSFIISIIVFFFATFSCPIPAKFFVCLFLYCVLLYIPFFSLFTAAILLILVAFPSLFEGVCTLPLSITGCSFAVAEAGLIDLDLPERFLFIYLIVRASISVRFIVSPSPVKLWAFFFCSFFFLCPFSLKKKNLLDSISRETIPTQGFAFPLIIQEHVARHLSSLPCHVFSRNLFSLLICLSIWYRVCARVFLFCLFLLLPLLFFLFIS